MDKVTSLISTFLGNTNYINFFSILVVALTSYQVAKYNASKPNKLKVKQAQLEFVYLPLYRISIKNTQNLSLGQAIEVHKKIAIILDEHYVLAYPQLHTLNTELEKALYFETGYNELLKKIFHQVSVDYELLKKALGYPSENIFSIFIRMTNKQKLEYALAYLNVLWFIVFFISIIYDLQNNASPLTGNFILAINITMIALNVFHIKKNNSKNTYCSFC